jgi:uncharacterized protein (TIGR03382 family)
MLALALALLVHPAEAAPRSDAALPAEVPGAVDTGLPAGVGDELEGQVVGGHRVEVGAWPDVALVWLGDGLCTGTLVHPQWVVTAGHCVYGDGASPQQIFLGATSFGDVMGHGDAPVDEREVLEAIPHPAYKRSQYGHDIALVKLSKPITEVEPSPIARDCVVDHDLKDGGEVFVVGWGSTTASGNDQNYTLNAGRTEVQTKDCSENRVDGIYTGCDPDARPAGELGAGGNGTDACFGDSGGPLYLRTDVDTYLVGVTSRAYAGVPYDEPCGHGGIYTRPDSVVDWIESTIGAPLARPICTAPPSASADPVVAHPGKAAPVTLHVTDADGAAYTVTVKTPPAHGTVSIDGEQVTYTPEAGFEGDDPFVLTVTDDGSAQYPDNPHATVDVPVTATVAKGCGCADTGPGGLGATALLGLLALRRRR